MARPAIAQEPEPPTRTSLIEQAQAQKAGQLEPYAPAAAEKYLDYAENFLTNGRMRWHPFFSSAYAGGGFTLGAGYLMHIGSYDRLDVRASITPSGYKRVEAEYVAPSLFGRHATLSLLGGWREATEVGFYGVGHDSTEDSRTNYGFEQPYAAAALEIKPARPFPPTRRFLVPGGGLGLSQWQQTPGAGDAPSIETVYTPETLPGLGAKPTYLQSHGFVGIDWRPSPGYARRGGAYRVTFHDFSDRGSRYGFTQTDYDVVQHVPILRDAWVLSFHGRVETTSVKPDQQIPFFMLPSNGGGSNLRGFSSWRFRDRHKLVVQTEWRILANRFLDMAVFYDAGKVTARKSDLNLAGLRSDYGLGFRMHGPSSTPVRIELAKSAEGFALVFASSASF